MRERRVASRYRGIVDVAVPTVALHRPMTIMVRRTMMVMGLYSINHVNHEKRKIGGKNDLNRNRTALRVEMAIPLCCCDCTHGSARLQLSPGATVIMLELYPQKKHIP
jgi:hypothetical protein